MAISNETTEAIREYVRLRPKFETTDTNAVKADPQFAYWTSVVADKDARLKQLYSFKMYAHSFSFSMLLSWFQSSSDRILSSGIHFLFCCRLIYV